MDEVFEMLIEARQHAPYRSDVHKLLGDAYYVVEEYEQANVSYLEHLRLGGTDPFARERVNDVPASESSLP